MENIEIKATDIGCGQPLQELIEKVIRAGINAIRQSATVRAKLADAHDDKFYRFEYKNEVERRATDIIARRAGGVKGLGSNQAAQQAELERRLNLGEVYRRAAVEYNDAVRKERNVQNELEYWLSLEKMHKAALYAIGGMSQR